VNVFPFNPQAQVLTGQPARFAANVAATRLAGVALVSTSTFNCRAFNAVAFGGSLSPPVVLGRAASNTSTFNARAFNAVAIGGSTGRVIHAAFGRPARNTSAFNARAFNAVSFGGSTFGTVLTLREAVNARLRGLSALTAIVGNRIYKQDPSQLSSYPCIAVELPERSYGYNLAGHDGTSLATLKFTAFSSTESAAVAAIEVIRNSMQGFRGLQSGVPILWCYLDGEEDDTVPPPDGSDQWIYEASVTYRVKHRVPTPSSVTQTNV
jgi:hypothetical protein